jgi:dTDP-glucose pyrophosphorylase
LTKEPNLKQFNRHIAPINLAVWQALVQLNDLAEDAILFIIDFDKKLTGSLTDGDIRRGFINGLDLETPLEYFIQKNPKYIEQGNYQLQDIIAFRDQFIMILPVVNHRMEIINIVNFRHEKSYLPVDALIMAGGRGERLKPLTNDTPKPLLKVGNKPILEHNIDRLNMYGIDDVWISLRYLGSQIESYFGSGTKKSMRINYVNENKALGTAGALSLVKNFVHDYVLMMNSDLLTNIDFEEFFLFFEEHEADFAVACIPYEVSVPYAVMETENNIVTGFVEKPTYTHYSNAGIYLMKREVARMVPSNEHFNATDLMEKLIKKGKKVVSFRFSGYWLDIGRREDFEKANKEINTIKFA